MMLRRRSIGMAHGWWAAVLLSSCAPTAKGPGEGTGDTAPPHADPALFDEDQDGFPAYEDCDDQDPAVHPDATERCNGRDDDCDGLVDDEDRSVSPVGQQTVYLDADLDSFGDPRNATSRCVVPEGFADRAGDCDDQRASVNPGALEVCGTGLDEDCDGMFGDACGVMGFPDEPVESGTLPRLALPDSAVDAYNLFVAAFDLDGDGTEDALVGDPNQDGGRGTTGVIHALWGDGDPERLPEADFAVALESGFATRPMSASFLAFRMAVLNDATGDGRPDLAVTTIEGVWLLESGGVGRDGPRSFPDVATLGIPMWSGGPVDLQTAQDVDDDGLSELLVFEPYVGLHLFWGEDLAADTAPDLTDALVVSRDGCRGLGKAGTAAGIDLDGDGFAEVAAGCPDQWTHYGEVPVFSGETLHAATGGSVGINADESCLSGRAPGLPAGTHLGRVVSHAGDLNDDGYPDLAVSQGAAEVVVVGGGLDRLQSLPSCGTDPPEAFGQDHVFAAVPPSDTAGRVVSMTRLDDVSGDGVDDLFVVANNTSDLSANGLVFSGGGRMGQRVVAPHPNGCARGRDPGVPGYRRSAGWKWRQGLVAACRRGRKRPRPVGRRTRLLIESRPDLFPLFNVDLHASVLAASFIRLVARGRPEGTKAR